MSAKLILFVCLLSCFLKWCLSGDQQQITVKTGADVTLQCLGPKGGDIKLLKWRRQDLKEEGFVYYYKGRPLNEDYQHSTFHNRVELVDPERKDGDVSVILKNVTINDTGTYECYVAYGGSPELISTITLTVRVSGADERGGDKDGHVGLIVGLSVFILVVVVVVVVSFIIYRRTREQNHQPPAQFSSFKI